MVDSADVGIYWEQILAFFGREGPGGLTLWFEKIKGKYDLAKAKP